jgi:copper homeostasis protein
MHKLEVIVTSVEEAAIAAAGGADRLELVRDLDTGGLTPDWETVRAITAAVSIPVRVMVRENASMAVVDGGELKELQRKAAQIQDLPIDGLVMGWVTSAGALDVASLEAVLAATKCKVTFHRAFEDLADPLAALQTLKGFKQIDRILTGGGPGSWMERKQRLLAWSKAAAPEIIILAGGGLSDLEAAELMADPRFSEVHVGRAVRMPQENDGVLIAEKIALLKIPQGAEAHLRQ